MDQIEMFVVVCCLSVRSGQTFVVLTFWLIESKRVRERNESTILNKIKRKETNKQTIKQTGKQTKHKQTDSLDVMPSLFVSYSSAKYKTSIYSRNRFMVNFYLWSLGPRRPFLSCRAEKSGQNKQALYCSANNSALGMSSAALKSNPCKKCGWPIALPAVPPLRYLCAQDNNSCRSFY